MSLTYPRDKKSNETDEEYFNYLHDFYYSKFIGREDVVTIEEDVPINTNTENNQNENNVGDTNSTPDVNVSNNSVDIPVQSESTSNNNINISNEYTNIVNVNNNESHVPYTNSTDIPGTNILKPRDRDYLETDEEYEAYLKEYYDYYFPNTSANNNVVAEEIDLYTNEENNLYYVTDDVAETFGLHSAAYPGVINGVHCYRITSEDVEKLIREVNSSNNRYRILTHLFARKYERSDEPYQSFDRGRR